MSLLKVLIVLIPVLPFVAFLANGLFGRALGKSGGWFAVLCMGASALIGVGIFLASFFGSLALPVDVHLWNWMSSGNLNLSVGFHVDQLTALMLSFVTFVSTLVFLYSVGYMDGDKSFNRFFAYLGLFDFSMLVLVLGDSLPVLFVGWEGVGLCSYLLIGYYLDMPGAADAGKKAFIVNRIGDFGFLVGMFMIFAALGTLNIHEIVELAPKSPMLAYGGTFVTWLTLAIFLGCTGKSAQIPLFVWLPDAMAGPTPVSALIHAATMVTAGIYLVVRLSVLFALAPATLTVMAVIGAATAFVAGTIALTQTDIKKVLAYSTVSQLGYMFLGCGVGAFVAGIFHVFTHAFFKAALFLGAGSVIHAAHHEQDMRHLGGLRAKMPITSKTFFIACLSIAGVPPLAGFVSKDEILWRTFSWHGPGALPGILYIFGLLTALMTAIYSFRAYFMTFEGKPRLVAHAGHGHGAHAGEEPETEDNGHGNDAHAGHGHDDHSHGVAGIDSVHESPSTMTLPLILLAAGAILAGLLNLPAPLLHLFGSHAEGGALTTFLAPVVEPAQAIFSAHAASEAAEGSAGLEWGLMALSVLIGLTGIALAWKFCLKSWPEATNKLAKAFSPLYNFSLHRWYWDDFYNIFAAGGLKVVAVISTLFDRWVIDGILHTVGGIASGTSRLIRIAQNGQVQAYSLAILIGVNVILWLVFGR